jgi:hypothetical protein
MKSYSTENMEEPFHAPEAAGSSASVGQPFSGAEAARKKEIARERVSAVQCHRQSTPRNTNKRLILANDSIMNSGATENRVLSCGVRVRVRACL